LSSLNRSHLTMLFDHHSPSLQTTRTFSRMSSYRTADKQLTSAVQVPTESLPQCFSGCLVRRLSACTRVPHRWKLYGRASFIWCQDPKSGEDLIKSYRALRWDRWRLLTIEVAAYLLSITISQQLSQEWRWLLRCFSIGGICYPGSDCPRLSTGCLQIIEPQLKQSLKMNQVAYTYC